MFRTRPTGVLEKNWINDYFRTNMYRIIDSRASRGMESLYQSIADALVYSGMPKDFTTIQHDFKVYLLTPGHADPTSRPNFIKFNAAALDVTRKHLDPENRKILNKSKPIDAKIEDIVNVKWNFDLFTLGQLQDALQVNFIILNKDTYERQIELNSPNINFVNCVTVMPSAWYHAYVLLEYSAGMFHLVTYNNVAIIDEFRNLPEPIIDMYLRSCGATYLAPDAFEDLLDNNDRLLPNVAKDNYSNTTTPMFAIHRPVTIFKPRETSSARKRLATVRKAFTITPALTPEAAAQRWIEDYTNERKTRTADPLIKAADIIQRDGMIDLTKIAEEAAKVTQACPAPTATAYAASTSVPKAETYHDSIKEYKTCCKENWQKNSNFCKKLKATFDPSSVHDFDLDRRYPLATSKRIFVENLQDYYIDNCGSLKTLFSADKKEICEEVYRFIREKVMEVERDPDYQAKRDEYEDLERDYTIIYNESIVILNDARIAGNITELNAGVLQLKLQQLNTNIVRSDELNKYLMKDSFYPKANLVQNLMKRTREINKIKDEVSKIQILTTAATTSIKDHVTNFFISVRDSVKSIYDTWKFLFSEEELAGGTKRPIKRRRRRRTCKKSNRYSHKKNSRKKK